MKDRDLKRNPGLIGDFRENPLLRFAKFDTPVENFKEGMRKVADELGLELLKTVENGAYEEDVVMETILVTADEFIFVCFRVPTS